MRPLNNIKIFGVAILIAGLFGACDDQADTIGPTGKSQGKDWTALFNTGDTVYGAIYVTAETGLSNDPSYIVGGAIHTGYPNSVSNATDGGGMTSAGVAVSSDTGLSDYYYLQNPSQTPEFGQTTTFALAGNSGNSVPSFSTTMYLPSRIQLQHSHGDSIKAGLDILWNQDGSNGKGVYIDLRYDGELSHSKNSLLPATDTSRTIYTSSDDGSYTLTSSDVAGFPVGGYVRVTIGRGNGKLVTAQSKKYNVYGYSISGGYFIVK